MCNSISSYLILHYCARLHQGREFGSKITAAHSVMYLPYLLSYIFRCQVAREFRSFVGTVLQPLGNLQQSRASPERRSPPAAVLCSPCQVELHLPRLSQSLAFFSRLPDTESRLFSRTLPPQHPLALSPFATSFIAAMTDKMDRSLDEILAEKVPPAASRLQPHACDHTGASQANNYRGVMALGDVEVSAIAAAEGASARSILAMA